MSQRKKIIFIILPILAVLSLFVLFFVLNPAQKVQAASSDATCTGCTTTYFGGNTIYTFISTAGGSLTAPNNLETCSVLVVAGGGAGGTKVCASSGTYGTAGGAGGGAGGVISASQTISAGTYAVVVGGGGQGISCAGGSSATSNGNNGQNSSFNGLIAVGGGGGGYNTVVGNPGGSGGGSSTATVAAGTSGQGNSGGQGTASSIYGRGGGGGASAAGHNGTNSINGGGGAGIVDPISGSTIGQLVSGSYYIGGGGGAGAYSGSAGAGGNGGGGAGGINSATTTENGTNGAANTGGGGGGMGGGTQNTNGTSGAGGSGVVILSCLTTPVLTTINISPSAATLAVGSAGQQLTATTLDQAGNSIAATLIWVSSNTSVATVNSSGLVTVIAVGSASITASSGGVTSTPSAITAVVASTVTVTSPINNSFYGSSVNFAASAHTASPWFVASDLDSSLISWWQMDDNAANKTVADYMGVNAGTAQQNTSVIHTTGKTGTDGALSFNGTSDYVSTNYVQTNTVAYTISAWIKTTSTAADIPIIQDRGGTLRSGTGKSLTLGLDSGNGSCAAAGKPFFAVDSNNILIGACSTTAVNDGNWHHVVGTWSAPSGTAVAATQFKLYVDGVLASSPGTVSIGTATSPLTGLSGTQIGYHQAWGKYFSGFIDDTMIFNRALTADEVTSLYNGTAISHTSNLVQGTHTYKAFASDTAGNVGSSIPISFTVDTTAPTITAVAPASSAIIHSISASSAVNYTLSEAIASGTITMIRTGTTGTADSGSPHICTLTGAALNSGAHTALDMSNTNNGCIVAQSLVGGDTYTFTFNATDLAGNAATAVSNTGILFTTVPGAPTDLRSPSQTSTTINLSWTAPTDIGGNAITGYEIDRSIDGQNWSAILLNTGSASTSYSDTAFTPATLGTAPHSTASWMCLGVNGGKNSGTCTATRLGNPPSATFLPINMDYCSGTATFSWNYVDNNSPAIGQQGWEMQLSTDSAFANIIYDSDQVNTITNTVQLPAISASINGTSTCAPNCNHINYGVPYYWRVKVWNKDDQPSSDYIIYTNSDTKNTLTFPFTHPRPSVNYTVSANIIPHAVVTFTDTSTCFSSDGSSHFCSSDSFNTYKWWFTNPNNPTPDATTFGSANWTYANAATYSSSLQICDNDGFDADPKCCPAKENPVTVKSNTVPNWQEISPF